MYPAQKAITIVNEIPNESPLEKIVIGVAVTVIAGLLLLAVRSWRGRRPTKNL